MGAGVAHTITAQDQNTKCIIALDNAIQSPIVATAVTTGISTQLAFGAKVLETVGVTSFFSGDLVRISEEIMKINTVGYGATNNILVDRGWMGTNIGVHTANSIVSKIQGNYNIIDNTINFIEAPHGKNPLSTSTAAPEYRDWTGITTSASFQGRVFTRSGVVNGTTETYTENYLYDDIS